MRKLALFANGTPAVVTHFAGVCGVSVSSGDGGAAATSSLAAPYGLTLDPTTGSLLIAEFGGHKVRRVNAAGVLTTLAGTGAPGYGGNGGSPLFALLRNPASVAVDPVCGTLFVSETWNCVVRRFPLNGTGVISVAAGVNANGFYGDGLPATAAALASPRGIDIDMYGRLFIADSTFARVRVVEPGGAGPCAPPATFTTSASASPSRAPSPSGSAAPPTPSTAPTVSAASSSPSLSAAPSASATNSAAPSACPPGSAPAPARVFTAATSPAAFYAPPRLIALYVSLWGAGGAGGNLTAPSFAAGGGGAFVGGWLGSAGLAALAAGSPLLVVAGGGGAYWPPPWAAPPVGGAYFTGASAYPYCGGTGAGASAVGLPGAVPLAVAGAGGGAGEAQPGRGATWDGSVPSPPCVVHGVGGLAFAGQSASLSAGGAPGCGCTTCANNGTAGGGPMLLPAHLATGGRGASCGGVGGGGFFGGGGGGWWNGGGAGSSFVGGLTGAWGQSAAGRIPGGAGAPGYAAGVGAGAAPRGSGGDGLVTLLPCVASGPSNDTSSSRNSSDSSARFPCNGDAKPSVTLFAHTGKAQSYVAPPNTTALFVALWGGGGSPGRYSDAGGGAFVGGFVGVPFLPPAATNYSVLVGSGGAYSVNKSVYPPAGYGAWPKTSSDIHACTGTSAGAAALGVVGAFPTGAPSIHSVTPPGAFLPLAAAGAGGSGGEQFSGGAATGDGTPSFTPSKGDGSCSGGSGFGGGSGGATAGGTIGCGSCCPGPGAAGAGTRLTFPAELASGGKPSGCGGGGGGGVGGAVRVGGGWGAARAPPHPQGSSAAPCVGWPTPPRARPAAATACHCWRAARACPRPPRPRLTAVATPLWAGAAGRGHRQCRLLWAERPQRCRAATPLRRSLRAWRR